MIKIRGIFWSEMKKHIKLITERQINMNTGVIKRRSSAFRHKLTPETTQKPPQVTLSETVLIYMKRFLGQVFKRPVV